MVNISLASIALAASIGFYLILDDAIANLPEHKQVDVWHRDGWSKPLFPTEKSMKETWK